MDEQDIESGLKAFVANLEVGGQRVPIDRVIRTHLALFEALRAMHLTWPAIATLVVRAGGRRRNGEPMSADQIRADVGRLLHRRNEFSNRPDDTPAVRLPRRSRSPPAVRKTRGVGRTTAKSAPPANDTRQVDRQDVTLSKAVSSLEIAEVLKRVSKS